MTYFVPVRKIIKVLWTKRGPTRRERETLALAECLDKNVSEKGSLKKYIVIRVLLVVIAIVMTHQLLYDTIRDNIPDFGYLPRYKSSEDASAALMKKKQLVPKVKNRWQPVPACHLDWIKYGKITVNKTITTYLSEKEYPMIQKGGYYSPEHCKPRHKVGILVPYRNRKTNLAVFLYNIHPFLMRQNLEYRILIIEQKGTESFNRGFLFNVGYMELKKFGVWNCVIFHDVDLLPLDQRILYSCPTWPRHMCGTVVEVTNPTFHSSFGGVSAMSPQIIEKVNGYSNFYWGWGGEDDDMFWRYFLLSYARNRYRTEGLSSLKYKVESVTLHHLYTHILVDINPNKENITAFLIKWSTIQGHKLNSLQ